MEYDVEFVKVKDIKPYKKNAKKHPVMKRKECQTVGDN